MNPTSAAEINFVKNLYEKEIIQFGQFELKTGVLSPFYIDMRKLVSYPSLINDLVSLISTKIDTVDKPIICGIPYGAIPVATHYAMQHNLPMLILRKEAKSYGMGRMVEGAWETGQSIRVMEDVVTSGSSIVTGIEHLQSNGLTIKDIIVFIDRQQGGVEKLKKQGYTVHSILNIKEIIDILKEKLLPQQVETILNFIKHPIEKKPNPLTPHPLAKKLLEIAIQKKSNIILSADVDSIKEVFDLLEQCSSHICGLKIHADIYKDFSQQMGIKLSEKCKSNDILLIEDRKFGDIGQTQEKQFQSGISKIASWADAVTAHFIAGESSLLAFNKSPDVGIIGIAEMSSIGTLTDHNYTKASISIMQNNAHSFLGLVAQKTIIPHPFLKFSPGVHLSTTKDEKGQQYQTPSKMIKTFKTDFLIVGRGIYAAPKPKEEAINYQETAWHFCEKQLTNKLTML